MKDTATAPETDEQPKALKDMKKAELLAAAQAMAQTIIGMSAIIASETIENMQLGAALEAAEAQIEEAELAKRMAEATLAGRDETIQLLKDLLAGMTPGQTFNIEHVSGLNAVKADDVSSGATALQAA